MKNVGTNRERARQLRTLLWSREEARESERYEPAKKSAQRNGDVKTGQDITSHLSGPNFACRRQDSLRSYKYRRDCAFRSCSASCDSAVKMEVDLGKCLEVAKRLALQAGKVQAGARREGSLSIVSKGGIDLVTNIDKQCEKIVFEGLQEAFPEHNFIGEESAPDVVLSDAPTWCVDPVDGTTNFIHNFPMFCVSIGLCVGREPVLGVIFDPSRGELYHAVKGRGAFCQNNPIHVDNASSLNEAVVCTNFGHSRDPQVVQAGVDAMQALLKGNVRGIRMTGSCCVAMCHVARGLVSSYYESDIGGLWDVVAGTVIVTEAGGVVCHPDDGRPTIPLKKGKQRLCCGNQQIVEVIHQHQYGHSDNSDGSK